MFKNITIFLFVTVFFLLASYVSEIYAFQTYDLSDSSNWNIRIDGAGAGDHAGGYFGEDFFVDINSDGRKDLVVTSPGTTGTYGHVYIILNTILEGLTGTGNTIDLSDSSNWNLRIDTAQTSVFYVLSTQVGDIDNNGKPDMMIIKPDDSYNTLSRNGAAYIIKSDILEPLLDGSTGKTLDLSESSSWNLRIDGPNTSSSLGWEDSGLLQDLNQDGKLDFIVAAAPPLKNGAVYILYNSLLTTTGVGNTLDLSDSSDYNILITPQTSGDLIGLYGAVAIDKFLTDSENSLFIGAPMASYNSRIKSGSIYIIPYRLLSGLTGVGNSYSLADTDNYFLRYDGSIAGEWFGDFSALVSKDIDNNGVNDLLLGTYEPQTSPYGHVYFIKDSLLSTYSGVGNNIDLANTANYHVDIRGVNVPGTYQGFTLTADSVHDHFGLGKIDLLFSFFYASVNKTAQGSVYIISNALLNSYTNLGDTFDLGDLTTNVIRYDGALANDSLHLSGGGVGVGRYGFGQDFNGDDKPDLMLNSPYTDNNGRTSSGSLYIIYNFPHSISITTTTRNSSTLTVAGTVNAVNSTTAISGVEYQIGSNDPLSGWNSCSAIDGSFNSTVEDFSCYSTTAPITDGNHQMFIRTYDVNGSYTVSSKYTVYNYRIGSVSASSTEEIQIPQLSNKYHGIIVATAIKDSSPNSQNIVAITFPQTFNFDAFLSSQAVLSGNIFDKLSDDNFKKVGYIQNIWYKTYPLNGNSDMVKIIKELQHNKSIINLSYANFDIGNLDPRLFKIYYSSDGNVWKAIKNSIVDLENKTVSAIDYLGGYYTIGYQASSSIVATSPNDSVYESEDQNNVSAIIQKEENLTFWQKLLKYIQKIIH